jgi:hypothetical protein
MIQPDKYRKEVKKQPALFILKWVDVDDEDDDKYYVQVEGDENYLTTDAPKATVFSYAQAEMFRFKYGKHNLKRVPRYSEVRRYVPPEEVVEVNQFWKTPPKQTEDSVQVEPEIAIEKPVFFKSNPFKKKETTKKFWE